MNPAQDDSPAPAQRLDGALHIAICGFNLPCPSFCRFSLPEQNRRDRQNHGQGAVARCRVGGIQCHAMQPLTRPSGPTCRCPRARRSRCAVTMLAVVAATSLCLAPRLAAASDHTTVDGQRAFGYLEDLCRLGPRFSGSPGMQKQRKLVMQHFTSLGATVRRQQFSARHPLTNGRVRLVNLICHWHPDRDERILLAAHYDTRPLPDRDPNRRRRTVGRFLGANDGASGVALLMELAHHMTGLDTHYGIDFVLLDGEEFVYNDRRDPYFLGSRWFARRYVEEPPPYRYRWGVLFDMVADAQLQLHQERHSMSWPDTRPLVTEIWETAERLGVHEFIPTKKHRVRDDHLMLRNIGRIPTCDIIDFDYPYWHTEADTPSKCSADSLAKVGRVIVEWLQTTR